MQIFGEILRWNQTLLFSILEFSSKQRKIPSFMQQNGALVNSISACNAWYAFGTGCLYYLSSYHAEEAAMMGQNPVWLWCSSIFFFKGRSRSGVSHWRLMGLHGGEETCFPKIDHVLLSTFLVALLLVSENQTFSLARDPPTDNVD